MQTKNCDYLIIGAGIIGLTIARELKSRFPNTKICIIEKESDIAMHASGRNSGVLHAGFYYSADSLKAKFTQQGNQLLQEYCDKKNLKINKCGKLVVALNEKELEGLEELKRRGDSNNVPLTWMDEKQIQDIDPNAKTFKRALFSKTTATIDPVEVCNSIKDNLISGGVELRTNVEYKTHTGNKILTTNGSFDAGFIINCAGLYADKIARDFGYSKNFVIIPFKGIYLKYTKNKTDVKTNIYPVPNLANPFLGVHYTVCVDGTIKIGPTAIPAFWRENYKGFSNLKLDEFFQIVFHEAKLFLTNAFGFRNLAINEMKKYNKNYFVGLALTMVKDIDRNGFNQRSKPGIRAQLLNIKTMELVQDFVIEGDKHSMHVLNAVSPAFTCAMPFARYVVEKLGTKNDP